MSKLLAMMMKPKNYMYATIKGSLTENNGVFSGFSSSNYLELQNNINLSSNFEIKIKFTPSSQTTGSKKFFSLYYSNSIYLDFYIAGTTPRIDCQYSGGSYWSAIASNLSYDIPIIITISGNGTTLNVEVNQNNNSQSSSKTLQELGIENITTNNIYFGRGHGTSLPMIDGSIDLNQSYIKIQNTKYQLQAVVGYTVVGSPTIVDGVVSGFSSGNYLKTPSSVTITNINKFEIELTFKFNSIITTDEYILSYNTKPFSGTTLIANIRATTSKIRFALFKNSSDISTLYDLVYDFSNQLNKFFKIKLITDMKKLNIWLYDENGNTVATITQDVDFAAIINSSIFMGCASNTAGSFENGSIKISDTNIKINNKLWFNGQPTE